MTTHSSIMLGKVHGQATVQGAAVTHTEHACTGKRARWLRKHFVLFFGNGKIKNSNF